jgi:hypothetical protein
VRNLISRSYAKGAKVFLISYVHLQTAIIKLTGMDGPRIAANLPTPWVGVWERICIGVFMLWVVVLAVALLRAQGKCFMASDNLRRHS